MCDFCGFPDREHVSRRAMLGGGAALFGLAAAAMPGRASAQAAPKAEPAANTGVSPDEALKRLIDGNARYVANQPNMRDFSAGRAARATAQYPFAAILGCADSRVAPELTFDQGPGDLFVVRVAGNFVNDDGLASFEFGTAVLGAQLILVLGHSGCGAVKAAIEVVQKGTKLPGHLPGLVASIVPAVAIAKRSNPSDLLAAATVENVKLNMRRLTQAQPVLAHAVSAGKLKIAGGVYDLATGQVAMV